MSSVRAVAMPKRQLPHSWDRGTQPHWTPTPTPTMEVSRSLEEMLCHMDLEVILILWYLFCEPNTQGSGSKKVQAPL